MLSESYSQPFQTLRQMFQQWQGIAADEWTGAAAQSAFREMQHFFQNQIVDLDLDRLADGDRSKVQSYQTEISKQLRLLGMDMQFLKGARQPDTRRQRQQQISDRIQTLIRYCDAVLEANGPSETESGAPY